MVWKQLAKYFPLKANSLDEFMSLVEIERGTSVVAEATRTREDYDGASKYEYQALFKSETPSGRPIIFQECYGSRTGIDGYPDGQRGSIALQGLLTMDDRLQRIKQRLPSVETALKGPQGIMNDETRQRMYQRARELNLSPL